MVIIQCVTQWKNEGYFIICTENMQLNVNINHYHLAFSTIFAEIIF